MAEYEPWNMGCLGCAQEAMINEMSFEYKKREAEEYAKKNKIDLVIYMEAKEWQYLKADIAFSIGIVGREIIRFSQLVDA